MIHIYFECFLPCLLTLGLQLVMILGMPSWSLIPGIIVDLSTRVGLVVKNKSQV